MDDPNLAPELHRPALRGLGRVNWLSRTANYLARNISTHPLIRNLNKIRILDLACGGGDVTYGLARCLSESHSNVFVEGWDMSPTAVAFAENAPVTVACKSRNAQKVSFRQVNILEIPISQLEPKSFDVVLCTLFLHHLNESDATEVMKRMSHLSSGLVLIDDLRRTQLGLRLAQLGCRLLSRSSIVHTDGPMSVRAAFREDEVRRIASQADIGSPQIIRHWPQRFLAIWSQSQ